MLLPPQQTQALTGNVRKPASASELTHNTTKHLRLPVGYIGSAEEQPINVTGSVQGGCIKQHLLNKTPGRGGLGVFLLFTSQHPVMIWKEVSPGIWTSDYHVWKVTKIELHRNKKGKQHFEYIAINGSNKETAYSWEYLKTRIMPTKQLTMF